MPEAGSATASYIAQVTPENPLKKPRKRKAYSDDSNESVADIFGVPEPRILSTNEINKFLSYHPQLIAKTPYPMAVPKTLIGIEVEVENVLRIDPNIPLLFWQHKGDGSLRNRGIEFVTPGTLPAAFAEPALRQLFDGLNKDIDFSQRTSIHIHMDVRQLSLKQALGLLLTYTAIENVLFKYVGLTRRSNIFCVPITEAGLLEQLSDHPQRVLHSIDQHWSKYTAFNLLPMVSLGSVEFRHMPGTSNLQHIIGWIDLITRLKRHAYRYDLNTIVSQIAELNGNSRYKQFLELIFEDAAVYLDSSNLIEDMERPVYLVKNSMVSNKFHAAVMRAGLRESSQLWNLHNAWKTKLSDEQRAALTYLCSAWKAKDEERIFKDIVARPALYLKTHPEFKTQLETLLKTKVGEEIKSTSKDKNFTLTEHIKEWQSYGGDISFANYLDLTQQQGNNNSF